MSRPATAQGRRRRPPTPAAPPAPPVPRTFGTMGMLPISEVARRTGVSSGFIYKEIRAGRLGAVKFSARLWRVHESVLDAWIQSMSGAAR